MKFSLIFSLLAATAIFSAGCSKSDSSNNKPTLSVAEFKADKAALESQAASLEKLGCEFGSGYENGTATQTLYCKQGAAYDRAKQIASLDMFASTLDNFLAKYRNVELKEGDMVYTLTANSKERIPRLSQLCKEVKAKLVAAPAQEVSQEDPGSLENPQVE